MFDGKAPAWHKPVTTLLMLCLLFGSGCLADPRRAQSNELVDRLAAARAMLEQDPPPPEACIAVGDIETRLYGEPGLVETQPAWTQLADAADALQAACGQTALLAQPTTGSVALEAARTSWQQGVLRQVGVACDHLREAANALGHTAPC